MYATLKNRLSSWLYQQRRPEAGVIVLGQRRVFIVPTRQGLTFAAVLLLMLTGSINYNLSLGFVLTFLLGALWVNGMIYTYRNLANLRLSGGRARPVFAGDTARFTVNLENASETGRYSLGLTSDGKEAEFADVPARGAAAAGVRIPAPRRGILHAGPMRVYTRYPLGLYYAWSNFELDLHCLVYPRPAPPGQSLPPAAASPGEGMRHGQGHEDFSGLREYHRGDSPRHIAWKLAARDQGLLTKQFAGRADTQLWLDWNRLPAGLGVENRLSQLARWVLDAHAAGLMFGLRMPGTVIDLGSGDVQQEKCLEALALFSMASSE